MNGLVIFSGQMTLDPGEYEYKFQCLLPSGLPTSLEAEVGYIRYIARVILIIPYWRDQTFEEKFTVIRPLNLNDRPVYAVYKYALFFQI